MPNFDKDHTAGATGQQMILTPSRHLILPLSFRRSCCTTLNLCFVVWIFEMVDRLILLFFIKNKKNFFLPAQFRNTRYLNNPAFNRSRDIHLNKNCDYEKDRYEVVRFLRVMFALIVFHVFKSYKPQVNFR